MPKVSGISKRHPMHAAEPLFNPKQQKEKYAKSVTMSARFTTKRLSNRNPHLYSRILPLQSLSPNPS